MAEQKLAQAQEQKRISQRELGLAAAQLAQRSIRSPFDGVVAERYVAVGERVEDKPLFRVAQVDPLKVQVVVPAAYYGKIAPGAAARIQPQLPEAGGGERKGDAWSISSSMRPAIPSACSWRCPIRI